MRHNGWIVFGALLGCSPSPAPSDAPKTAVDAPLASPAPTQSLRDPPEQSTAARTGLTARSSQPGVAMSVDGQESFELPLTVDLPPGDHVVRFEGDRYVPLEKTVTIVPGKMADLGMVRLAVARGVATFALATPGATIILESPSGDRRQLPSTPISVQFPGKEKWVIHATKAGYCEYTRAIDFGDGVVRKTYRVELQQGCAP